MSWCCLTSGDERFAIKIEGYARNDDTREALSKCRGASSFFAPTPLTPLNPLNPQNPQNPQNPLNPLNFFRTQSRGSTPTGLTLKFESRDEWLGMSDW